MKTKYLPLALILTAALCCAHVEALTLSSIAVSPSSATVNVGSTQQFIATASYSNGTKKDVTATATWKSSSAAIATVSGGLATGASAGTATITATLNTKSSSATLKVNAVSGQSIVNFDSPGCPNGNGGQSLTGSFGGIRWGTSPWDCEIVGSPTDTTTSASWNQNVTRATFSFVTPSVLISLKAGTSSGSGTYSISTDAGESISVPLSSGVAVAKITTNFQKPATVVTIGFSGGWTVETDDITYSNTPIVGITISPTSANLLTGAQQQFSATVTNCGTSCGVNWAVSGNGTVDFNGLYTAPATAETDTVTASAQADLTKSASATVVVSVATTQHTVTLNWNDADPVTFNIYRSTVSGSSYQLLSSGITVLNYTDSSVVSGTTYYYVVTAFNGQESAYSNETPAVIPYP